MPPSNPIFTVDTHIFRELGELLVGRDSTALMELIKNAYDADATEVVVTATDLANPDRARIVIQDNGCGMTAEQFRSGFLRIASRFKEGGRAAFCDPRPPVHRVQGNRPTRCPQAGPADDGHVGERNSRG